MPVCTTRPLNICVCVCLRAQLLQSCPTLSDSIDCSSPGSSVHGDSPGRNTGVGFFRGSSQTRDRTHVFCIAARFFTAELPGSPNTCDGYVNKTSLRRIQFSIIHQKPQTYSYPFTLQSIC